MSTRWVLACDTGGARCAAVLARVEDGAPEPVDSTVVERRPGERDKRHMGETDFSLRFVRAVQDMLVKNGLGVRAAVPVGIDTVDGETTFERQVFVVIPGVEICVETLTVPTPRATADGRKVAVQPSEWRNQYGARAAAAAVVAAFSAAGDAPVWRVAPNAHGDKQRWPRPDVLVGRGRPKSWSPSESTSGRKDEQDAWGALLDYLEHNPGASPAPAAPTPLEQAVAAVQASGSRSLAAALQAAHDALAQGADNAAVLNLAVAVVLELTPGADPAKLRTRMQGLIGGAAA